MRVVIDTNTAVSGLLWHGSPRQVLDLARSGKIELFSSVILLAELKEVLLREKFLRRFIAIRKTPNDLVWRYANLVTIIQVTQLAPVILDDPDDDAVLACAIAAQAEIIVSGDKHLLNLEKYQNINIVSATACVTLFSK
jgi:putative PIN family toxin of toxin-antitoxin system